MEILIKKDLIKITNDFILGVILNEMIEIANEFRKEFIDNNWHCPEFFEINIEKISEENMINASKSSMRRYIKKLENLGFISIDKFEKKHKYRVNFKVINDELEKIGGEIVEKVKPIFRIDKKEFKKSENSKNNIIDNVDEFDGFTQTNMFEEKKIVPDRQELNKTILQIQNNINYNTVKEKNQDENSKDFLEMFESIYRVMIDVMTTSSEYIRINKENKPISVARNIFSKINYTSVLAVIEKIKRVKTKIINLKSYIITALYNYYIENPFHFKNLEYIDEKKYIQYEINKKRRNKNRFLNYDHQRPTDYELLRKLELMSLMSTE